MGTVLDIVVGDVVAVADVEGVAEEAIVAPDAVDEFVEGAAFDAAPAAASVVAVVLEVVPLVCWACRVLLLPNIS